MPFFVVATVNDEGKEMQIYGAEAAEKLFVDILGEGRRPKSLPEFDLLVPFSDLLNEDDRKEVAKATKELIGCSTNAGGAASSSGPNAKPAARKSQTAASRQLDDDARPWHVLLKCSDHCRSLRTNVGGASGDSLA